MRRVLVASMVGLVGFYIAGAGALGSPPDADSTGREIVAWMTQHDGNARAWVWCGTLALIAFGVFASLIRPHLPSPHRDVFFFGSVTFAAETAISSWFLAGLSWHADQLEPATARTLFDIASFWGPVLTSTTVLMLAPVALLGLRREAGMPRWLGVVAGIAVLEQLIETITIFGDKGFTAPGGPMNLQLGAGLTVVAFLCTGVVVARSIPGQTGTP